LDLFVDHKTPNEIDFLVKLLWANNHLGKDYSMKFPQEDLKISPELLKFNPKLRVLLA